MQKSQQTLEFIAQTYHRHDTTNFFDPHLSLLSTANGYVFYEVTTESTPQLKMKCVSHLNIVARIRFSSVAELLIFCLLQQKILSGLGIVKL